MINISSTDSSQNTLLHGSKARLSLRASSWTSGHQLKEEEICIFYS